MSYQHLGAVAPVASSGGFGQTLGLSPSRRVNTTDARLANVPTHWAQRGINAYRARYGGQLIYVDGRAGPITLGALRQLATAVAPGFPSPDTYPVGRSLSDGVTIPIALENTFAQLPPVANPPRPSSSTSTSTRPAASSSGAPGVPAALPGAEPAVLVDEGSRGWLASLPSWALPVMVVGGVTLLGLVGIGIYGRRRRRPVPGMASNMTRFRRRSRRPGKRTLLKKIRSAAARDATQLDDLIARAEAVGVPGQQIRDAIYAGRISKPELASAVRQLRARGAAL